MANTRPAVKMAATCYEPAEGDDVTVTDKYLDAGLLALREIDESREGRLMHPNEAAALLQHIAALQREHAASAQDAAHNETVIRTCNREISRLQTELKVVRDDLRAVVAQRNARATEVIEQCRPYMQHSDECGDQDSYNNVEPAFRSCGCGLDSLLEALAQPDAARAAGERES